MTPYGQLYIDRQDAYSHYGAFLAEGGFNSLLQIPSPKSTTTVDWHELNGVKSILPTYDDIEGTAYTYLPLQPLTHSIQLHLADRELAQNLFARLTSSPSHVFKFYTIGNALRTLRLADNSNFTIQRDDRYAKITLSLVEDMPDTSFLASDTYDGAPVYQIHTGYYLDGQRFADLGWYVLEGTDSSFHKLAKPKQALVTNLNHRSGQVYDGTYENTANLNNVRFQSQDITVKLLLRSDSIATFSSKYDTLRHILLAPATHQLRIESLNLTRSVTALFKSSSVQRFCLRHDNWQNPTDLWLELNLVFSTLTAPDDTEPVYPTYDPDTPNPYLHDSRAFSGGFSQAFS